MAQLLHLGVRLYPANMQSISMSKSEDISKRLITVLHQTFFVSKRFLFFFLTQTNIGLAQIF